MKRQLSKIKFIALAIITLVCLTTASKAQTTTFTYQGKLNDTSVASPTNGTYEMQFKLFTTAQTGTGTQISDAQTIPTVQVVNGIFTVQLDAENAFNSGADLYIEISVRPAGSQAALTTLAPRQQVTSAPYSVQSRNAVNSQNSINSDKLGNLPASNYTHNNDTRLSDDRNPLAGSTNYIQNTTSQQSSSNFNVSGGGTLGGTLSANLVNSVTNYRIGGSIVLGTPNATSVVVGPLSNYTLTAGNNAFFGYKAGAAANNTGQGNVFFGSEAGTTNSNGAGNSFVGRDAGFTNSSGNGNSFFGNSAGKANTIANFNSFFGSGSGISNTTGEQNSFFGFQAGQSSKIVNDNSFFGYQSGKVTVGGGNSFFGSSAGIGNTTGSENTFIGNNAGNNNTSGSKNTIIGSSSFVAGSNNTSLGNETTVIGSTNTVIGYQALINGGAVNSTVIGAGAGTNKSNTVVLGTAITTVEAPNLLTAKNIDVSLKVNASTVDAGLGIFDAIKLNNTPFGDKPLCIKTATKEIGICPSNFSSKTGETSALANAFSQQQTQIEAQQKQLQQQQILIENLRKLVCATNSTADVCQEVK